MPFGAELRAFIQKRPIMAVAVGSSACGLLLGAALGWQSLPGLGGDLVPSAAAAGPNAPAAPEPSGPPSLTLSEEQARAIKVETVSDRVFVAEELAVGSIDFNEDLTVQVYPPYQGRIVGLFGQLGDPVTRGQLLFTIESPDLIQAESTLIATAGVLDLNNRALNRARQLYTLQGIAQKDLEQTVSDQQTAEGALRAARDAVRVFGKTDTEIDRSVATRHVDRLLDVHSPVTGKITARNAAPGMLVQPGTPPAPFAVADLSTVWMLANVAESDSPLLRVGQDVTASMMALPGRVFTGTITQIGATIDPNTHRVMVRSAISDPGHELRPGMLATFAIRVAEPVHSTAVPSNAVVREGDGTMRVWTTTDRRTFVEHTVKLGLLRDGFDQVIEGINAGDLVATDGAIFLSNKYAGGET